jgi:hypothetical protein
MHACPMGRFENARLARMSSGHYCVIRDLGLVKGGKGLRHHEWCCICPAVAFLRSRNLFSRTFLSSVAAAIEPSDFFGRFFQSPDKMICPRFVKDFLFANS